MGTSKGREEAAHHQAARISARSCVISNEKFCDRENFRKFRSEIRPESHAISRAAAYRRSARMSRTSEGREQAAHHQAAWILVRSHAISDEKFRGRGKISKFSVENRTQSRPPQHADARHEGWGPHRVVSKLRSTRRHGFRRDLTGFRTKNFTAAEKLRN